MILRIALLFCLLTVRTYGFERHVEPPGLQLAQDGTSKEGAQSDDIKYILEQESLIEDADDDAAVGDDNGDDLNDVTDIGDNVDNGAENDDSEDNDAVNDEKESSLVKDGTREFGSKKQIQYSWKPTEDSLYGYCGTYIADVDNTDCCGGKLYYRIPFHRCCGTNQYNIITQECYQDRVWNFKIKGWDKRFNKVSLCNNEAFNPESNFCYRSNLYDRNVYKLWYGLVLRSLE